MLKKKKSSTSTEDGFLASCGTRLELREAPPTTPPHLHAGCEVSSVLRRARRLCRLAVTRRRHRVCFRWSESFLNGRRLRPVTLRRILRILSILGRRLSRLGLRRCGAPFVSLLLEEAESVIQVVPLLLQSSAQPLQQLQLPLQSLEVTVTQRFLQNNNIQSGPVSCRRKNQMDEAPVTSPHRVSTLAF